MLTFDNNHWMYEKANFYDSIHVLAKLGKQLMARTIVVSYLSWQ